MIDFHTWATPNGTKVAMMAAVAIYDSLKSSTAQVSANIEMSAQGDRS